jgi:hypothetical protein
MYFPRVKSLGQCIKQKKLMMIRADHTNPPPLVDL